MTPETRLPSEDLEFIVREGVHVWPELQDKCVFITGATGFFGKWLLEGILAANKAMGLGIKLIALSRSPEAFLTRVPHLGGSEIRWIRGSVAALVPEAFAGVGIDLIIHMATEANIASTNLNPLAAHTIIGEGTRRVLEVAKRSGTSRFLFTSTGAVYGAQPENTFRISEDNVPLPDSMSREHYAVGAEAKRQAEIQCIEAASHGITTVIARGFTFGGPGTPARSKFAIGNFIQDVLEGKPIVVKGDGTPIRSYMYGADLAVWLWTLLAKGRAGRAYNVGSEREVSILSLAEAVSAQIGKQRVEILCPANPRGPTERYVPSTQRARDELHLKENFELHQIIRKTVAWERSLLKH